jgi:hypothetical protein
MGNWKACAARCRRAELALGCTPPSPPLQLGPTVVCPLSEVSIAVPGLQTSPHSRWPSLVVLSQLGLTVVCPLQAMCLSYRPATVSRGLHPLCRHEIASYISPGCYCCSVRSCCNTPTANSASRQTSRPHTAAAALAAAAAVFAAAAYFFLATPTVLPRRPVVLVCWPFTLKPQ